jgi:catechol 2,3-dioxygenase-like lactoylglutathione lyase family enzyme
VNVLGRSPAWVGGYPGDETECVVFQLDNLSIELLAARGETSVCRALRRQIEENGGGVHALHLACDDLATTTKALRENGMQPSDSREGLARDEPSGAFRRFLESDLDPAETAGVRIKLVEPLSEPEEHPPSLTTFGERAAVQTADHVVIFTADPDRAIDLYAEKLGIRLALDKTFEARGTRLQFFRLGGFTIEIGSPLKDRAEGPVPDDRLWGIAYRVDDIAAAAERIADSGLEVSKIREGNKPGTRVCTVKNEPAGVATLLIEHD